MIPSLVQVWILKRCRKRNYLDNVTLTKCSIKAASIRRKLDSFTTEFGTQATIFAQDERGTYKFIERMFNVTLSNYSAGKSGGVEIWGKAPNFHTPRPLGLSSYLAFFLDQFHGEWRAVTGVNAGYFQAFQFFEAGVRSR